MRKHSQRGPRPASGFSSLEWGFVAVIIMLLLGCFAWARVTVLGTGRRAACASNLLQVAQAMHIYAVDYDGHMPATEPQLSVLVRLARNSQLFLCPEAAIRREAQQVPAGAVPWAQPQREESDYYIRLGASSDDDPRWLLAWDDVPDRHLGSTWIAARVDGSARVYPSASFWRAIMLQRGKAALKP